MGEKVRFSIEELLPFVNLIGGALQGAPSHLAAAAAVLWASVVLNGKALPEERATKMVEDVVTLIQIWDTEPKQ